MHDLKLQLVFLSALTLPACSTDPAPSDGDGEHADTSLRHGVFLFEHPSGLEVGDFEVVALYPDGQFDAVMVGSAVPYRRLTGTVSLQQKGSDTVMRFLLDDGTELLTESYESWSTGFRIGLKDYIDPYASTSSQASWAIDNEQVRARCLPLPPVHPYIEDVLEWTRREKPRIYVEGNRHPDYHGKYFTLYLGEDDEVFNGVSDDSYDHVEESVTDSTYRLRGQSCERTSCNPEFTLEVSRTGARRGKLTAKFRDGVALLADLACRADGALADDTDAAP